MKKLFLILISAIISIQITACFFPGVHKIDIDQGNIIKQENVDQLKTGMTKRQARYIMGTPLIMGSFNQKRWDYFYSLKDGKKGGVQERVILFFDDQGLLSNIDQQKPELNEAKEETDKGDGVEQKAEQEFKDKKTADIQ